jgi:hypothetical protein
VPDCRDPNRLPPVSQLIEDAIGADPQRVQPVKLAAKGISGKWIALQQTEGVLDCVDQRPVQFEQVPTSSASENQSRQ